MTFLYNFIIGHILDFLHTIPNNIILYEKLSGYNRK